MRSHPCMCTACGRTFDIFKHLRKHWDVDCITCPPTPTTPPPSPPPRLQIDPAQNMWLNDDLPVNGTNDTGNKVACGQAGGTSGLVGETCGQAGDTCGQPANTQNELIMLLLGAVEQLFEIVLGARPTMTPSPTSPHTTPEMHMPSKSQSNSEWTMVTGKQKPVPRNKQQGSIECRNIFEVLESIPTENPSLPTSIVEVPTTTWADSPSPQSKRQRRPNVVVSKFPERVDNWKKTVPGNSSFAEIVKHGKKVVLFSDSICNRFSEWKMNSKTNNCTIKKKSFPGATALDLAEHHVHPYLKRNSPDTALIHVGANDILQLGDKDGGITGEVVDTICTNILTCGMVCKQYGINTVCISSILPGQSKKFKLSAIFINNKLESMCREVGFDFLSNKNIIYEKPSKLYDGLFYKDGLHLNDDGRDILMGNFIEYLDHNYLNNHSD